MQSGVTGNHALTAFPPVLVENKLTPAVFLDKDGSLIEDVPYNVDPAHLRFTSGAVEGVRMLAEAGFPIVLVTNQPGLTTGRFTRAQFAVLQKALTDKLEAESGVALAGVYVCPHAPDPSGLAPCLCRKPAPGLLRQAAMAHRYDLSRSWMIGDILDDIEAGRRAGCRTILLDVGNETIWRISPLRMPHYRCASLFEAAKVIVAEAATDGAIHGAPVFPAEPA
nr:HAD family hydrolase [Propionivibrio soli]